MARSVVLPDQFYRCRLPDLCIFGALAENEGWTIQVIDGEIESVSGESIKAKLADFQPAPVGEQVARLMLYVHGSLKRRLPPF